MGEREDNERGERIGRGTEETQNRSVTDILSHLFSCLSSCLYQKDKKVETNLFLNKRGVICVLEQITPEDTTERCFFKAKCGSYDCADGCVIGSSTFCCVPPG